MSSTAKSAISSGFVMTSGTPARSSGLMASSSASTSRVSIQFGTMQFTRTPSRFANGASVAVSRTRPAFAAAYSGEPCGCQPIPATEEMLTTAPPPLFCISGSACWIASIGPRRLRSRVRLQCSTGASGKCGQGVPPALLTRTSSPPKVSAANRIAARISSSRVMSASTKAALPPASSMSCIVLVPPSSSRSLTATAAPRSARARAIARPVPAAPAPVTSATFPSISTKALQRRGHEPRQRAQVVAALQDGRASRSQRLAAARELAEPVLGHVHPGERILGVRVEAGGDEHLFWLESRDRRLHDALERVQVLVVSGPGRERNVERRLGLVVGAARARVEGPLVQRDEEDGPVVLKDRLRSVPVVHVPVDDRHALDVALGLQVTSSDGDVVEDAEPHRGVCERVVPGWPHEREALLLRRGDRDSRSPEGRVVRRSGGDRVAVEPGRLGQRAHLLDVVRRVAALDLRARRGRGLLPVPERVEEHLDPPRRVRMVPRRVQPNEIRMAENLHA